MNFVDLLVHRLDSRSFRQTTTQPQLPSQLSQPATEMVEKADTRESMAANPLAQAYMNMGGQAGLRKASNITFQTLRRMSLNNWVDRTCITTLRDEITAIPWDIVPKDPKKPIAEGLQRYLVRLLKKPNKNNENWRTLIDKTIEDILVCDAGVWEKVRDQAGRIVELWHVDGATIKPIFDVKGRMGSPAYKQYMLGINGLKEVASFNNKDMVYMMWNPQGSIDNYGYGYSPVEAGLAVGTAFLYAEAYNLGFFQTNTIPGTIISLGKNAPPAEIDRFRMFLSSEMQGLQGFHQPVITSAEDLKIEQLFKKPEEMAWAKYVEWQMRWKVALYRMSPQDIGFTLDQYKVEGSVQQQLSKNKAINSLKNVIQEYINTEIIGDDCWGLDDANLQFSWIDSDVVDPLVQAQVDHIYLQDGVVAVNDVRTRLGKDPIQGGTTPVLQTVKNPIPLKPEEVNEDDVQKSLTDQTEGIITPLSNNSTAVAWMDDRGVNQPLFICDYGRSKGFLVKSTFLDDKRGQEYPEEKVSQMLRSIGVNTPEVKIVSYDDVLKLIPNELYKDFTKWLSVETPYFSQTWVDRWGTTRKSNQYIVTGFLTGRSFCDQSLIRDMQMTPDAYTRAIRDLARMWIAERKLYLGDRKPGHYIITNDGRAFGVDYQFYGSRKDWEKTSQSLPLTLERVSPRIKELFDKAVQQELQAFTKSTEFSKKKAATDAEVIFDLNEYEKKFSRVIQQRLTDFYKKCVHLSSTRKIAKALEFDPDADYVTDGMYVYQADTRYPMSVLLKKDQPSEDDFDFPAALYSAAFISGVAQSYDAFMREARLNADLTNYPKAEPLPSTFQDRKDFLQDQLSDTTREAVSKVISRGIDDGKTYAEIGENIRTTLGVDPENPDVPQWRAERIARTESQWSINEGIRQQYKALGYEELNISLAPDACDDCQTMYDNGPYSIESEGLLPVHPNCRCSFTNFYEDLPVE